MRAAVIFDRDGTLNRDIGYPHKPEDLIWMPGAKAAIAALNRRGILVVVASNQSGVARGKFDETAVARFHEEMQAQLAKAGAHIDAFYYCPFLPDAPVAAYRHPDHPDRKPNPGMILRVLADCDVDPARTVLIGDSERDMAAAAAGGVRGVRYEGGDLETLVARETEGL
jgi:D-glycero-D-manno-heptose 1,7-bisphosphate phosphatase